MLAFGIGEIILRKGVWWYFPFFPILFPVKVPSWGKVGRHVRRRLCLGWVGGDVIGCSAVSSPCQDTLFGGAGLPEHAGSSLLVAARFGNGNSS